MDNVNAFSLIWNLDTFTFFNFFPIFQILIIMVECDDGVGTFLVLSNFCLVFKYAGSPWLRVTWYHPVLPSPSWQRHDTWCPIQYEKYKVAQKKSSFLNVLHMIWWRLQGGSFSIPIPNPKNYIADWIEDNGLEENKFLSLLFTYKWEWKLDGLPIILKTADCPGCGRLGPVSLPSLNAQWPRVALVSNNMIAYLISCPANQMISNCHLGLCRSII